MYNTQQKEEFLRFFKSRRNVNKTEVDLAIKTCNWIQKYEQDWGCDFCNQADKDKLQEVVNWLTTHSIPRSGYEMLIILREYVRWCNNSKIPGAKTVLLDLTADKIEEIKLSSVSSPSQLQNFLSAVYRPEVEHTVDNIYRVFYWLAYSGLEEKDSYNITSDNIDFQNNLIHYNGLDFPIYRESIPTFQSCASDKTFSYHNDIYTGDIQRDRLPGKELMRGVRSNATYDNKFMRIKVSQKQREAAKNKQIVLSLSYFKVWRSGIFYKEWIQEKDGRAKDQSFKEVAKVILKSGNRSYKEGESASKDEKYKRIIRELERTYKLWKIANSYA